MMGINYEWFDIYIYIYIYIHTLYIEEFYMNKNFKAD